MHRIIITGPAKQDIQVNYDWWAENRSAEQAERWYRSIHAAIQSLRNTPDRCSGASETEFADLGIRQLLFGLGRRATHRIVFAVDGETVVVLRVRHTSQDALSVQGLTQDS